MSRIYEALQNAQEIKSKRSSSTGDELGVMDLPERRANSRVELDVELTVYGRDASGAAFYTRASAHQGNCNGGLIVLSVPVREGEEILLINNRSSEEQLGRIANVRALGPQEFAVGVAFESPKPTFWQIPE